ncbi:MAG: hypothetical protein ABIJ34_06835 [archaeon]
MDKRLTALYLLITVLLLVQSFSHIFIDEGEFVATGYYMASGEIPHKDFVQFHNMFYFVFYLPFFLLSKGPFIHILIRLISAIFTMICAYMVFSISKKNRLGNPHISALIFLVGYTGMPISFLRNEYFAMVTLLAFFYFENQMIKGFVLALFGASSIMAIIPAGLLFGYLILSRQKNNSSSYIKGALLATLFFCIFMAFTSFDRLYNNLFELSVMLGPQITRPWHEVVFFSVFFAAPYLFFGGINLIKNWKKNISKEVVLLLIGIFGSILVVSLISNGIVKAKLPSYLPAIAILAPYCTKLSKKILVAIGLLTILVYTPSFNGIMYIKNQYQLNNCIKNDTIVQKINDNAFIIFRERNSYYWYNLKNFAQGNMSLNLREIPNPITLCGYSMEKTDFICSSSKYNELFAYCNSAPPKNMIYLIRDFVFRITKIKLSIV